MELLWEQSEMCEGEEEYNNPQTRDFHGCCLGAGFLKREREAASRKG